MKADFDHPTRAVRRLMREHLGDRLDELDVFARALGQRDFPALRPGDGAPGFTLPDARGGEVSLDTRRAAGPVVVLFYRGAWCPYCNLQLRAFQDALEELRAESASLVAISPQTPDGSLSTAEMARLEFPVLSDVGSRVAERYGIAFSIDSRARDLHRRVGVDLAAANGEEGERLPAAATVLVGRDGRIAYASVAGDYRRRAGPGEVLEVLRG
jgi:peroxiredoxin